MKVNWFEFTNYLRLGRSTLASLALDLVKIFCVKIYLAVFLVINTINWLIAFVINKNTSGDLVFLHYNVNFGVNLIGSASQVYVIPILGLIFIIINFILLFFLYRQDKFIIHLLMSAALLSNLFLLAAVASVYLINF